jgi:hypothetical protein
MYTKTIIKNNIKQLEIYEIFNLKIMTTFIDLKNNNFKSLQKLNTQNSPLTHKIFIIIPKYLPKIQNILRYSTQIKTEPNGRKL